MLRCRFFSSLIQRAAKLARHKGGGSLSLLLLGAGMPARGEAPLPPLTARYDHLSEQQRQKLRAALEAAQQDARLVQSDGCLRTEVRRRSGSGMVAAGMLACSCAACGWLQCQLQTVAMLFMQHFVAFDFVLPEWLLQRHCRLLLGCAHLASFSGDSALVQDSTSSLGLPLQSSSRDACGASSNSDCQRQRSPGRLMRSGSM